MTFVGQIRRSVKTFVLGRQRPEPQCPWQVNAQELADVRIAWPRNLGWQWANGWVDPLLHGFRSRIAVTIEDIPQELAGVTLIMFHRGKRVYRVGINTSDYPDLIQIHSPEAALDLEFKMQYRNDGYDEPRVVPGGYISDRMLAYWYARRLQRERDRQRFRWDVYGRFGTRFATEVRGRAIGMLQNQHRVQFYGGHGLVNFTKYLREIAHSRVCIDLPGNGPFCFRLVDYLAVGACIISVPHATRMPVPLIDRRNIIYTKPDMSDLVDLCEQYAHDETARENVTREAQQYYRQHLYWRSLSDYYLRTLLDRLPA